MESSTTRYLFDANALRRLSYDSIKKTRNINTALETTPDICYELGEGAAQKLKLINVCKMSDSAYRMMSEILKGHESVRILLDYYNNKGVGDVGLLAYALTVDEDKLLKDMTIVVTNDRDLKIACKELGIKAVDPSHLHSATANNS